MGPIGGDFVRTKRIRDELDEQEWREKHWLLGWGTRIGARESFDSPSVPRTD
jgi:hypothetical protein